MTILNLTQLAMLHNIDRSLVRKTMSDHPDFPYMSEINKSGRPTYSFETALVDRWLLANDWSRGDISKNPHILDRLEREAEEKAERQVEAGIVPVVPDSVLQIRKVKEEKNRKSDVQTALLQLELDKKRGMLVPRDQVINEFAPMIATLAKGLEMMPNLIGKRFNLPDAMIIEIRDYMDQLRETLSRSAKTGILSDDFVFVEDKDE